MSSNPPIPLRPDKSITVLSSPNRSSSPGSSIQRPMLVGFSPKKPSSRPSSSRPSGHSRSARDPYISLMADPQLTLDSERRASSFYNRSIIRGPPSVNLANSTRSNSSPYARIRASAAAQHCRPSNYDSSVITSESTSRSRVTTQNYHPQQYTAAELDARYRARRVARDAEEVAAARAALPPRTMANVSAGATRVRSASERARITDGWREVRPEDLTAADLFQTAKHPPIGTTDRVHQRCSICLQIKSHAVGYACGHSHCYVCIRLWLEHQFSCPICRTIMHTTPIRNLDYDAGIEYDFPLRKDESVVDYSFDRLRFPKRLCALDLWE
ncbi:hypothetical protein C8R43DRAFT_1122470 [Mycena crocata]|nr:hypothetical protein C8R43DRAFT_1122470 [Mycena crocata]